jgi:hypothetical protein
MSFNLIVLVPENGASQTVRAYSRVRRLPYQARLKNKNREKMR